MTQQEYETRTDRYNVIREFSERWHMNYDLLRMCLGDKISNGQYREVFEWNLRKDVVCKVAYENEINFIEYSVWNAIKEQPYSKWFAPIIDISPCGHYMLQKKVRPIKDNDKLPTKIPNFFTDVKKENFGFIGKQFVCVDYQFLSRVFCIAMKVKEKTRKLDFNEK